MRLEGKVAIVTDAAKGIGAANAVAPGTTATLDVNGGQVLA